MNPSASDDTKRRHGIISTLKALSGQSRQMVISRAMIDMCGGIYPALLLNQILHWSDVTTDPDGWFAHSYEEWEEETTLSKYHVMQSMKTLSLMGIQTTVRRSPYHKFAPIVHYRVEDEVLGEFVEAFFLSRSSKILTNESENLSRSDRQNPSLSKSEKSSQINTKKLSKKKREKESTPVLQIVDSDPVSPIGDSLSGNDLATRGAALLEDAFSVKADDSDSQPADSKTTEKLLPPPRETNAAASAAAKPPSPRNPLQEAVAFALNITPGGRAGKIGKFFAGALPKEKVSTDKWAMNQPETIPFAPETLPGYIVAFTMWYARIDKYKTTYLKQKAVPNTPETLSERWTEFCERPEDRHKYWFDKAQPVLAKLMKGEKVSLDASDTGQVESAQAYKPVQTKARAAYAVRTDPETEPESLAGALS